MESKLYWAIVKDYKDKTMSQKLGREYKIYDCLADYTIYENPEKAMAKCKEIYENFYKIGAEWIDGNVEAFRYTTKTIEGNEIIITFKITAIFTDI